MFIYQKREEKIDRDWAEEKWVHIVKQQKEGKKTEQQALLRMRKFE